MWIPWIHLFFLICACICFTKKMLVRKWYLSGSIEGTMPQCRRQKNQKTSTARRRKANIQFMKFLKWPFFSETCLGSFDAFSKLKTRRNKKEEHAIREISRKEYSMHLVELVLGFSLLFSWPFNISPDHVELKKRFASLQTSQWEEEKIFIIFRLLLNCFLTTTHTLTASNFYLISFHLHLIPLMSVCLFLLLLLRCCHLSIKIQS